MAKKRLKTPSFYRKSIVISIAVFSAVALLSSGFATWIISSANRKEAAGNVNVGSVVDAHVHFSDLTFVGQGSEENYNVIGFDAKNDDDQGRIRWDGRNKEHLAVTLTGKAGPMSYISSLTFQFVVPLSIQNALDAQYIALDTTSGDNYIKEAAAIAYSPADSNDESSFSITFGFVWGEYFKGVNPSLYYDDISKGGNISDDEMIAQMRQFRKVMYYDDPSSADEGALLSGKNLPSLQFSLNLVATTH